VQTQFTYQDVGVNIDMTPTVHYDREITLKMKIEVSSESGTETISGVTEPIISQRVIDQVIQLKEGEPSILAGILTRQDNKNISGTPYLGELPFFKFFFASTNKEVQRDEIVFLIIPHIVRESVLTPINTGAIDTGTGNSFELRHDASLNRGILPGNDVGGPVLPPAGTTAPAMSAADAATAMIQRPPASLTAGNAASSMIAANTAVPGGSLQPVSLGVLPLTSTHKVGTTFQVAVSLSHGHDVFSVPMQLQFDPHLLELVNVDAGSLLAKDNQAVSIVHRDEGNGLVTISTSRPPNSGGVTGDGGICTLTFKALAAGDSNLNLVKVGAKDSAQNSLPVVAMPAVVHIQ
jgi:general secretion pathway protein D